MAEIARVPNQVRSPLIRIPSPKRRSLRLATPLMVDAWRVAWGPWPSWYQTVTERELVAKVEVGGDSVLCKNVDGGERGDEEGGEEHPCHCCS
jgi:hypothetical protein